MKDFLTTLAKNLKSPILIFSILFLVIIGVIFLPKTPQGFQWPLLAATFIIICLGIAIYTLVEVKQQTNGNEKKVSFEHPADTAQTYQIRETASATLPPTTDSKNQAATLPSLEELLSGYLSAVIKDCQRARLVGLDPKASDPTRGAFSLDRLYVSLDTKTQEREVINGKVNSRPITTTQALLLSEERCVVFLGLPGSGKSTFVRYLALQNAKGLQESFSNKNNYIPNWNNRSLAPVIIPLGRFAESIPQNLQKGSSDLIESFIQYSIRVTTGISEKESSILLDNIRRTGGLFLFDGLDEVADLEKRPVVVEAVEDFATQYKDNLDSRFLVTCRTFSYTDSRWQLINWPVFEVAPLSEEKIRQYIDAWHNESIRTDSARRADYEEKRIKILQALQPDDRRKLREIADNPLILTVMAVVHTHKGDLPDARALVYEECIDLLLLRWEAERAAIGGKQQKRDLRTALDVPEVVLRNVLQEIAYHAHEKQGWSEQGGQTALVTEDLLNADLAPAFENKFEKVKTFLDYCESANGLLMLQGVAPLPDAPTDSPPRRIYAFPHLTFEEYLAARYLRRLPNLGRRVRQHLDKSDRWREVVMLLGEHLCFREGDDQLMDLILLNLAPNPLLAKMDDRDWRALWMAGDLLLLYRRAFPSKKELHEHILFGLTKLLEQGALTPRERAAAGNTLSALGDPRFIANLLYLPDNKQAGFVAIDAGTFVMGSDLSKDMSAQNDEVPKHEINLLKFYISCYLTTIEQYRVFVIETGYIPSNKSCLSGFSNHPVTHVNFYDAVQYCYWLNKKLLDLAKDKSKSKSYTKEKEFWQNIKDGKYSVSLPSEAEWERAARGSDNARRFPWGNGYQDELANVEMLIGQTTSVGSFPLKNNPSGIFDLSGNVFEWTRSIYQPYPYELSKARENIEANEKLPRVLRGGSFETDRWHCRCSKRLAELPNIGIRSYGFRVVVTQNIK